MADAGAARSSPASGSESSEDSRAGDGERAAGKAKSEEKATASTYKRSSTSPSLVARRYWWTSVSNWFAILENKTKKYVRRHLLISWLLLLLFLYVLALFNVIFLPSAIEAYPFLLRLGQPGYLALVSLNMLLSFAPRLLSHCGPALVLSFDAAVGMVNDVPEVRVLGLAKLLCLAGLHAEHDPQPLPHAAGRGERVRLVAQRSLPAAPEAAPARSPPEDSQVEAHCLDDEHARPLAGQPHRAGGAPGRSGARGYGGRHIGDGGDQPLEPSGPQEAAAGLIADALRSGQRSPDRAARGSGETVVGGPAHVLKAIDVGKRAEAARHEARGGGAPLLELLVDYEPPHQDDAEDNEVAYMPLAEGEDATKLAQQLDVIVSKFSCTSLNTFAVDFGRKECLINSENWPQLDVRIWKKIWACLDVEDCGAVEVAVLDGSDGHPPALKIVTHYLDLYPAPRADSDEEEAAGSGSAFFLKKIDAVGQDVFANDAKVLRALYTELKRSSMPGIEPLVTMQTPVGCRCDQDSCMQYTDSGGSLVAWCRISEDMLEHCLDANGVKVYKSHDPVAKTSFLWSPDLCRTRCSCSGIGMLGRAQADEDLTEMGEKCTSAGDPEGMKWCNVGVDSTCPDRDKTRPVFAEVPPAMRQFTSEVACLAENESPKSAVSARGVCVTVVSSIGLAIFMGTLTYLVVLYFLGRYLAIGCGDYVVAQTNQFEVTFDSDWWASVVGHRRQEVGRWHRLRARAMSASTCRKASGVRWSVSRPHGAHDHGSGKSR
eukprot:CAMPEP_0176227426 /NCGR_PEP_ID=MMETSP0121_2-20121125/22759_1 /TAXON_ID=160619 /ORGANISM="Kryptoperidinium foliaceum, Strain CCMP 1326" /LENGTH=770 /DNA_ID=CAMNT_0017566701 /DNA_START=20 /DNA_END=2332 /DNA_ORIENTATION=-